MITDKNDQKICEEIIWWANFLVSRGVNPKFVPVDDYDEGEVGTDD